MNNSFMKILTFQDDIDMEERLVQVFKKIVIKIR